MVTVCSCLDISVDRIAWIMVLRNCLLSSAVRATKMSFWGSQSRENATWAWWRSSTASSEWTRAREERLFISKSLVFPGWSMSWHSAAMSMENTSNTDRARDAGVLVNSRNAACMTEKPAAG